MVRGVLPPNNNHLIHLIESLQLKLLFVCRWRGTQEGLWDLVLVECMDKYGSGGGLLCLGTKRKEGNRFLFKVSKNKSLQTILNYFKLQTILTDEKS